MYRLLKLLLVICIYSLITAIAHCRLTTRLLHLKLLLKMNARTAGWAIFHFSFTHRVLSGISILPSFQK
jgi:hypothetical protein